MKDVAELWSYLSTSPLLWLTATLLAYLFAAAIAGRFGNPPWANPVLISVCLISPVLWFSRTDYATYFEGAQFIHFLLGPATVALALPLLDNLETIRRSAIPILLALLVGSSVAICSAILIAQAFGLPTEVVLSLSPKSTTAPVALGVSEAVGGMPSLTAVFVILTGIIGAIIVTPMMNALRIARLAGPWSCGGACRAWYWNCPCVSGQRNSGCLRGYRNGTERSSDQFAGSIDRSLACLEFECRTGCARTKSFRGKRRERCQPIQEL